MASRLTRRSLASVICALVMVLGALVVLGIGSWAGRGERATGPRNSVGAGEAWAARRVQSQKPEGFARLAGRSPLGAIRPVWSVAAKKRDRVVETPLGLIDPADVPGLRKRLPGLAGTAGKALSRGRRGELGAGFNAIQVDADLLEKRGIEEIESDLAALGVKVHRVMPSRAFLVEVPQTAVNALGEAGLVESAMKWDAMLKVDPDLGRTPFIQRSRAQSDDLRVIVKYFGGTSPEAARRDLEGVAGASKVEAYTPDGLSFKTTVHFSKIAAIARLERVQFIFEEPEYLLLNTEIPTTAMVGNVKENLPFQKPYHDAGVDGGGIDADANGVADGQRINDGSDVVPPQIVAVTDNGISYDSVQFAQTGTQPTTVLHPIGPTHRKVHAVQDAGDPSGSTCDSPLSGSGTHGNVVAGVIAGDGSSLGAFVSKATENVRPIQTGLQMDGLARGARIIMQDAADVSLCTMNDLIERGGNVNPGPLLTRLQLAICPISGGTGACTGVVGGGNQVHLQVFPFGKPNFDTFLGNTSGGTYTQDSSDIDTFLVNNRDYMVFAPVGNDGTRAIETFVPGGTEIQSRYPDLFDGTASDNDPNKVSPLQVSPPSTAKDLVSVGAHFQDMQTTEVGNQEENPANFTSKGPATALSMRTAPIIMGVGADITGYFGAPNTTSVAVWRSNDNDNTAPVDAVLDDINFGTSYAAGEIAGVAALIRDYFQQGFYPTGVRTSTDRQPTVSGPLVKAMIVASANFLEEAGSDYPSNADAAVGKARGLFLPNVNGSPGILGNNEQGYGRPVLTSVLPLANWPTSKGIGSPDTVEYPSAGLLIFDDLGTGEPPINNTTPVNCSTGAGCMEHTFTVDSESTQTIAGATARVVNRGQLRIARTR